MAEPSYGFPILDPESIVDTLAEYQIQIKLSQLRAPTKDFVYHVYSQIVQRVGGSSQNVLLQPVQDAVESLNTPYPVRRRWSAIRVLLHSRWGDQDLYSQSLPYNLMYSQMYAIFILHRCLTSKILP